MPSINRNSNHPWKPKRIAFEKAVDNKFYHSTPWRKFRLVFLQAHPLCVMCEAENRITPATTVDHIISINKSDGWNTENGRYPHPLDETNCQALCFKCHASKTGKTR